jgi:DNA-binding HxlR family transcriptional regulator
MSKSNCFANNDSANCAEFSIIKNAQNFLKKKKIVAIVEKILKRKKFFKSLSRDIDKISSMLRLENVADNEDFASRK